MISVPSLLQAGDSWSSWEVSFHLAEVKLQEGETLENALRRFKRKVQQEDIIKEVKRHSFYLKPGEKKRLFTCGMCRRLRPTTRNGRVAPVGMGSRPS